MADPINFIPLMLATLGLILTSFLARKRKIASWIILAFVIWLMTFIYTLYINGVFFR